MTPTDVLLEAGWQDLGGVLVNPEARDVPHPLRGTCVPECPMFGECHCGCGEPTTIQSRTYGPQGMVRGRPAVYARFHNPRQVKGCYSRQGVPLEKVEPMVRWLVNRYGRSGVPGLTPLVVDDVLKRRLKRWDAQNVGPERARMIASLVLAHRPPSSDPFATFESRRVISREEQLRMDHEEQARRRREHRYKRLGREPESEE